MNQGAHDSSRVAVSFVISVEKNEGSKAADLAEVLGDGSRDRAFAGSRNTIQSKHISAFQRRDQPTGKCRKDILSGSLKIFGTQ